MRKHGIKKCNPTAATCILRAGRTAAADKSDMDMMQRQRVGWRMREQKAVDGWALPVLPVNCSCICCTVKLQSMWSSACWKNEKKSFCPITLSNVSQSELTLFSLLSNQVSCYSIDGSIGTAYLLTSTQSGLHWLPALFPLSVSKQLLSWPKTLAQCK